MPSSSNLCSRQVNLRNFSLEFPPGVNQRRNSSWNFPSGAPEWASREFRMEFIPFQQKQLHELWNSWNLGFFFSSIFPNFSSIFPNYLIYLGQQNQLHGIQKFPEFPLFQIHFSHFLVLLVSQIIYFLQEKHLHGLWNSWNFPFFWSIFSIFLLSIFSNYLVYPIPGKMATWTPRIPCNFRIFWSIFSIFSSLYSQII